MKSTFSKVSSNLIMHFLTGKSHHVPSLPLTGRFAGKTEESSLLFVFKLLFKDDLEELLLLAVEYSLVSTTK